MRTLSLLGAWLALTVVATGQVPTFLSIGDVGLASNVAELRVMDATGSTSTGIPTTVNVQSVLWDPANPDDFIVGDGGGFCCTGFLVRVSFTSPGTAVTTMLSPTGTFGRPEKLMWDQSGQNIIVASSPEDQLYSVAVATGVATPITSGAQPWGNALNAAALDPLTGDIYVGSTAGDIYRVAAGGGGATLFTSGFGSIQELLIDADTSPHYLYVATSDTFERVDIDNPATTQAYFDALTPGQITNVISAAFDEQGDFLLGRSNDEIHRLTRLTTIPLGGVAPVFVGTPAFASFGSPGDISVVGGTPSPFRLTMSAVPVLGAEITIENHPVPFGFGWLLLSGSTFLPVDSGPLFGLVPDFLTVTVMLLNPTPGGVLAFAGDAPDTIIVPPLGMLPFAGQTWDGVAVAFSPGGLYLGRTNVSRVTWQ